jgi:hypothetical protein
MVKFWPGPAAAVNKSGSCASCRGYLSLSALKGLDGAIIEGTNG